MEETLRNRSSNINQNKNSPVGRDYVTAKERLSVARGGWITLRIGRAKRWWRRKGKHSVRNRYRMVYAMLSSAVGGQSKGE